jgi:methionyl-tRNA formyltransferase
MIPDAILATARKGGVNLHGSPLPRYRGRAPVNWMVLNGEVEGGAALHVMTSRPDAGPLLAMRTFRIGPRDTAFSVLMQVEHLGMDMLRQALPRYLADELVPTPQKGRGSYFGRRTPEDGRIDWTWPAERIVNLIRAVTRPYPGAFTDLDGKRLYVWWAEAVPDRKLPPGTMVSEGGRLLAGTATCALHLVDCTGGGGEQGE